MASTDTSHALEELKRKLDLSTKRYYEDYSVYLKTIAFLQGPDDSLTGAKISANFTVGYNLHSIEGLTLAEQAYFVQHQGHLSTCCHYSQSVNDAKTALGPAKPGILMRMLQKSDEVFCKILGRLSPWMLQEYGLFKIGFVQFTVDAKAVYYINKRIRKENLELTDLHWKELYLKKQISNDLVKMTPTLIALCLPVVYYFVLPLMFIYPTVFLSNQFLSRDKLLRHYLKSYQQRATLYPRVLEMLSHEAGKLQSGADKAPLQNVVNSAVPGHQVSLEEILLTKKAFQFLNFNKLSRSHLKCLCNLCSLRTMFMPGYLLQRKLRKNITLIQAMDHSIRNDGIQSLDHLDLEKLCYERGLNVVHTDKSELEDWLQSWLEVSAQTNGKDRSFIAHSVVLQVIGHPTCSRLQDLPISDSNTRQEEPKKD